MNKKRFWVASVALLVPLVAAAQLFGIPRRLFSLIVTSSATFEGAVVLESTLDAQGAISDSTGPVTINDASEFSGDLDLLTGDLTVSAGVSDLRGNVMDTTGVFTIDDATDITGALDAQSGFTLSAGSLTLPNASIADAALSANVPLLDQANAFTAASSGATTYPFYASHTTPFFALEETDGAANNQWWDFGAVSEQLRFRAVSSGAVVEWLTVDRTGTTVDAVNLEATDIQTNGESIAASSGTFGVDYSDDCTTSETGTVTYSAIGNIVVMEVPTQNCTSDTSTFDDAGAVPTALRPATAQCGSLSRHRDNSTFAQGGMWVVDTDGTLSFHPHAGAGDCTGGGTWTSSNTKTVNGLTFSYLLN